MDFMTVIVKGNIVIAMKEDTVGSINSSGSGVVAVICIGLAFIASLICPPLGFIIFWSWVIGSK